MAYTTIDDSTLFFRVKAYSGSGSAASITFDITDTSMQPDMVWIKNRSTTGNHGLWDVIRGATKQLYPNHNYLTSTAANGMTAFNSNGFSVGSDGDQNGSGNSLVAWAWKAGGSASSNGNGSITSSVSANTTSGCSIVQYSANNTAGATVGHGLGVIPKMIWVKESVGSANDWVVYHEAVGNTKKLILNETNAESIDNFMNDATPTANTFSISDASVVNRTGSTYMAYCFAEVKGYSKFGKYVANGNSDNVFVYTGFRPAFLLTKYTGSGGSWEIVDNKRDGFNGENHRLYPNDSSTEGTGNDYDLLSNGFKVRQSGGNQQSGRTNIYAAFAESPFVNSNGVPTNGK